MRPYLVQRRACSSLAAGRADLAATQITRAAIEVTAVVSARWRFRGDVRLSHLFVTEGWITSLSG